MHKTILNDEYVTRKFKHVFASRDNLLKWTKKILLKMEA